MARAPTALRRSDAADAAEKNRPLVDDIRLLGRILGDVILEQEGKAAFAGGDHERARRHCASFSGMRRC